MLRSQKRVTAGYGTGFRGLQGAVRLGCTVLQVSNTLLFGAKRRAENDAGLAFDAVTDDPATAVITRRRQFVNGAFKAIERVRCTGHRNFKRLVILIPANFTRAHRLKPPISIRILIATEKCPAAGDCARFRISSNPKD